MCGMLKISVIAWGEKLLCLLWQLILAFFARRQKGEQAAWVVVVVVGVFLGIVWTLSRHLTTNDAWQKCSIECFLLIFDYWKYSALSRISRIIRSRSVTFVSFPPHFLFFLHSLKMCVRRMLYYMLSQWPLSRTAHYWPNEFTWSGWSDSLLD